MSAPFARFLRLPVDLSSYFLVLTKRYFTFCNGNIIVAKQKILNMFQINFVCLSTLSVEYLSQRRQVIICITASYDSHEILTDIPLVLSSLEIVSQLQRSTFSLTPNDLFSHFFKYLPLLSPNALTWSFSFVTLFFHALPPKLQDAIKLGGVFYPIYLPRHFQKSEG